MVATHPQKARGAPGWAMRSKCVITPEGARAAAILVQGEKILAVVASDQVPAGWAVEDVEDRAVLPGLVDAHVHINEPGRTEWEGFASATRAAAAGGVTTLIDMPLNSSPVTTTAAALAEKLAAARAKLWVDCGFYGGVVPGNHADIQSLIDAGVLGLKAFLCHSGIDEFPNATQADLRAILPKLAAAGLPLLVHAELVSPLAAADAARLACQPRSYAAYLTSRPRQWEHDAIQLLITLCREFHCRVHIVHLSSADALPMIGAARAAGLPLSVETCPHYLCFASEDVPDGDPRFKCAPPIRERENREGLWWGLRAGLIDTVGSDHSPAPPELKHLASGDLQRAWGGIASLQLAVSAVFTEARRRGFELAHLVDWMSCRPAELFGLAGSKGALAPGYDADIVVFDREVEFTVTPQMLHHRHKLTPYDGRTLRGRVDKTFVRGRLIYDSGRFEGSPTGRTILRSRGCARGSVMDLGRLNSLGENEARAALLRCCGSTRWAERMAACRPFADASNLLEVAGKTWRALGRADWLEAFAAHPKIGDLDALRSKFAGAAAWPAAEQSGVSGASEAVLQALALANRRYEAKFGHIFIVCASGKSAGEMLALLQERLTNAPEAELLIAAAEQEKITRLRLERLCP